jgi:HB1, ASXL, restriction endonuclease HTH domain
MATGKLSTKQAIEHVLKGKRNPMRVPEIIKEGVPLTALKGKTPGQTFYSILYAEAKKADGLVVKVGKGMFKLNPKRKKAAPATGNGNGEAAEAAPVEEAQA